MRLVFDRALLGDLGSSTLERHRKAWVCARVVCRSSLGVLASELQDKSNEYHSIMLDTPRAVFDSMSSPTASVPRMFHVPRITNGSDG
jgi:hypothetical protein